MKSSQITNLFMNPFLMWGRHAWKTGEMAINAIQVINHRTTRISRAGVVPNARDQREFSLMVQEKAEAVMESAQATGIPLLMLSQQFIALTFKQMMSGSLALMSLAASQTPAESATRQSRLISATLSDSAVAASKLSRSAALLARSALTPVHKRVSANARRLGKR